jgi:glucose-6-phosphate isomerase
MPEPGIRKPPLTRSREWKALDSHFREMKRLHLRELFSQDQQRVEKFSLFDDGLLLDYSKNIITVKTMKLLFDLARSRGLKDEVERMFDGQKINRTEDQPALHVALRDFSQQPLWVDGIDIHERVIREVEKMKDLAQQVRDGRWSGFSGKRFRHIVNIGIGGSDLGPRLVTNALKFYAKKNLNFHFLSNIDGTQVKDILDGIDPEKTLFVVCSKTFSTEETMTNAESAKQWILSRFHSRRAIRNHFCAVTANPALAAGFGIDKEHIFSMWDWVGGRFSIASAIGFSTMIATGPEHFVDFLKGFSAMDSHFRHSPFESNIPVILALLGIWYVNFFSLTTQAVIPYDHYLRLLPAYLQQLEMESNGKSVNREGEPVSYQTAPVIWGETGTNCQHAFFQLLHQGTRMVPADFIGFSESLNPVSDHHQKLMAHFLAQTRALAFGKTEAEFSRSGEPEYLVPYRVCHGNQPTNTILADKLTPFMLGRLLAMYEHKVFVQGVIWDIFSFDQWGVELGKDLARGILPAIKGNPGKITNLDASTRHLLACIQKPAVSKKNQSD